MFQLPPTYGHTDKTHLPALPNDIPRTFLADSQYSEDMDIFSAEEDIAGVNNRRIWQKQQTKTKLKTQKLLFLKLRSSSELCYS